MLENFVISIVSAAAVILLSLILKHRNGEADLMKYKVVVLEQEIVAIKKKHEEEIGELRASHSKEITYLKDYIEYLLLEIQKLKGERVNDQRHSLLTPSLLLVCGNSAFGQQDENAITRAGMLHIRLADASFDDLAEEIQRRRLNHDLYKYVQISAHADRNGIQLKDGLANTYKLAEVLQGVELAILAGCSDIRVADKLIGSVEAVISVREEVVSELMENFSYSFWRSMNTGRSIRDSYERAKAEVPEIATYIDLRTK